MPDITYLLGEIAMLKAMLIASEARNLRKDERIERLEKLVAAFRQATFGRRSDRRLIVATSKTKRSADFAAFLENLDHPCGPKPGQPQNPVVIVQGNGPIHTGKAARAALTARAHWLSVEWLPKYAPELNDIETVWRDLKAHHLAHQTFTDTDNLDQTIHEVVEALNVERKPNPLANQRISA
jgi:transposase